MYASGTFVYQNSSQAWPEAYRSIRAARTLRRGSLMVAFLLWLPAMPMAFHGFDVSVGSASGTMVTPPAGGATSTAPVPSARWSSAACQVEERKGDASTRRRSSS